MRDLCWFTVKPLLKETLTGLMESDPFRPFRLVGGTSLSLQLGHRMSDDIDLFTDAPYGSLDFAGIDNFLRLAFPYVSGLAKGPVGMGVSYLVGNNKDETVKLDLYYTDSFIQPILQIDQFRLASIEEIIAMKIDIVQRKGRKKDFWDIHQVLESHTPAQMIALHRQRYPHGHDENLIRANFTDFARADEDFNPICMKGNYWELIKFDIVRAMQA